ncbi:hypothetical protein DL767_002049 [Monosporascus sp. MG133]|nr:hypothetical protein DL767_002049 [Monosporascus sp. MG133]
MRLLECSPDGGFTRTKDLPGNEDLEYAILSHTWGSEEVTLKDLVDGTGGDKAGYEKLRFCAERATHDGLRYIWVDACCIDKLNLVELNEAIISMFRWYRKAARCYVYLSDVSVASCGRKRKREESELPWEQAFRASRWFKRGWTLQELLAPTSVEFFSREGQRLGDKKSLEQPIHQITSIAILALRGTDLSQFDVDERFEWANSRETTREEDWAYCLLGIFGVSMPSLYGEGKENAIRRLRNEIDCASHPRLSFVLDKLPAADGAAFNSHAEGAAPTCHRDTRVDLLRQIREWADQPGEQPQAHAIFWLNGMAGTGKSTISRTVARHFADRRRLGASFFFKRGDGDRGKVTKFFTTIARQLVSAVPAVVVHVKNAIKSDPDVAGKAMREQFEKLVFDPLSKTTPEASQASGLVIVVDALDECERDDDVKLIINLFSRAKSLTSLRLRILVTSRPELPIRLGFNAIHGKYQDLVLHKIPEPVVEHDISAYLQFELARIRNEYNASVTKERQLASSWPGQSTIQILVKMAVPLFIFAATVCRFVDDRLCGDPDEQLQEILKFQTKSQESKLDATYLPVLNNPLPAASLARLFNISQKRVDCRLDLLHSVLNIPSTPDYPVRLFHLSFRDFLVDPEKREKPEKYPFWVDEKETHAKLATRCLQVMTADQHLRRDICNLQKPGASRAAIDNQIIDRCLPFHVQYACTYWVYHFKESGNIIRDGDHAHAFLRHHFLHWLEVLTILGRIAESISILDDLQSLLDPPKVNADWNACLQTLEGHSNSVWSVAFSHDSKQLVSASGDGTVKIWDVARGACLQTLEKHGFWVRSVAFSHDSKLLVSASFQGIIKIWDAGTGACLQTLKGHNGPVWSVAFSHNSKEIVSASDDNTVKIWDTATGACLQTLDSHNGLVWSVAFSYDSTQIVSASEDDTVKIWDVTTGACLRTFEGHSNSVYSVAFSHDSKQIASASADHTVKIWDITTGACLRTFDKQSDSVRSIAFSHDSKQLASASGDHTVKIWDAVTGVSLQTFECHNYWVYSVAFSHDSTQVVSASYDKTVKIWDTATGTCRRTLKGHNHSVTLVAFSHDSTQIVSASHDKTVKIWDTVTAFSYDSKQLASASYDKTVKIWDATTGACLQTLKDHNDSVTLVAFSYDSKQLVSASYDKTVKIWDVTTGACLQTLEAADISKLPFNSNGTLLYSNRTTFVIARPIVSKALSAPLTSSTEHVQCHGWALSEDGTWINLNSEKRLWLPPDYRPLAYATSWSTFGVGTASGRVYTMRFSTIIK